MGNAPVFEEGELSEPTSSGYDQQDSEVVDLTDYKGAPIHIALHYTSSGTGGGSAQLWRLLDVTVSDVSPASVLLDSPFDDDIEPWTTVDVEGDDVWDLLFVGNRESVFLEGALSVDPNEDWLISPPLDIAETDIPILNFDYYSDGPGQDVRVLVSTDYDADTHTDPNDATWTDLGVDVSIAGDESWTGFSNVSLYGFSGSALHVAFQYLSEDTDDGLIAKDIALSNVCVFKADTPPALIVNFSSDTAEASTEEEVQFTASIIGGKRPYSFAWDFGDGGSSTLINPVHVFATAGTYPIALTVTDAAGTVVAESKADYFTSIQDADVFLRTDFEGPDRGEIPEPWIAVDVTSDRVWQLDIQGGRTGVGMSGFNASEASEDWLISPPMTIIDTDIPILTFDAYVRFSGPDLLVLASTDYDENVHTSPGDATWTDLKVDTDVPESAWAEITDVSLAGLVGENVHLAFKYVSTGTEDGDGRTYAIDNVRVLRGDSIPPLQFTDFTAGDTDVITTQEVTFTPTLSGGKLPYTYAWDFGDGGTSTDASPAHIFATPGTYTVAVTVSDAAATEKSLSKTALITSIDAESILLDLDIAGVDDDLIPEPWFTHSELSDVEWTLQTWDGQQGAFINGFGADEESDDWLITPPFTIASDEAGILSFDFYAFFSGGEFQVLASNEFDPDVDSDPTETEWTVLDAALGDSRWGPVGGVNVPVQGNSVRIAFRYLSDGGEAGDGQQNGIDSVRIVRETLPEPDNIVLQTDFSGEPDADVPEPWTAVSVTSDANWQIAERDNRTGAFANGFGADGPGEDWLISPKVPLALTVLPQLTFDIYSQFTGPDLQLLYSSDYDSNPDPNDATWQNLHVDFSNLPNGEWSPIPPISLSGVSAPDLTFAFRYLSDGPDAGQSRTIGIDDLLIELLPEETPETPAPALTATFDSTPVEILTGESVGVTAFANGGERPYTFAWDFGDGTTADTASANGTYLNAGSFEIGLTVKDGLAIEVSPTKKSVTVIDPSTLTVNSDFEGEDDAGIPEPWSTFSVASSDREWRLDTFENQTGATINGFGGDEASDDWLISPPLDLAFGADPLLSFDFYTGFDGPAIEVLISGDYSPAADADPGSATWTPLAVDLSSTAEFAWTRITDFSLNGYVGNSCYIAFRYTTNGTEAGDGRRIGIDRLRIVQLVPDIPLPETLGFDDWKAWNGYFKKDDPRGVGTADPDGDGLSNFLEHRFLLDPLSPSGTGNLPTIFRAEGKTTIVYNRMHDEQNLWTLQASADMQTWTAAVEGTDMTTTITKPDDAPESFSQTVEIVLTEPFAEKARYFRVVTP